MAINTSISAFKSKVVNAGGFQRNNRFYVRLIVPPNLISLLPETTDADGAPTAYIAETVILPSIIMTTQSDSLSGPGVGRTSPRGVTYKDGIMVTFPVFGNWKIVNAMNQWVRNLYYPLEGTNGWVTNYYNGGNDDDIPGCELEVTALDINGVPSYRYNFTEVFPVELFPLQFSSLASNEILKFTVRFAFRSYSFTHPT